MLEYISYTLCFMFQPKSSLHFSALFVNDKNNLYGVSYHSVLNDMFDVQLFYNNHEPCIKPWGMVMNGDRNRAKVL